MSEAAKEQNLRRLLQLTMRVSTSLNFAPLGASLACPSTFICYPLLLLCFRDNFLTEGNWERGDWTEGKATGFEDNKSFQFCFCFSLATFCSSCAHSTLLHLNLVFFPGSTLSPAPAWHAHLPKAHFPVSLFLILLTFRLFFY